MGRKQRGEGSIGKTADGTRYRGRLTVAGETRYVYARIGPGPRRQAERKAKTQVAERLDKLKADAKLAVGGEQTVSAYLSGWLSQAERRLRPNTVRGYANDVRLRIAPHIGGIPLRDLTAADVERFQGAVADAQGHKAANRALETLRAALERARRQRRVGDNAAEYVDRLPEQASPPWPLTLDEAAALLAAARTDRLWALWEVLLCQGLREGEALGLCAADVDLPAGTVHVWRQLQRRAGGWHLDPLKTGVKGEAVLPMPNRVADALIAHQAAQAAQQGTLGQLWWDPHGWGLLFTRPGGEPIHAKALLVAFRRLCDTAGVAVERTWRGEPQRRRVHDLRHTTGSLLTGLGYPQRVVMAGLRHSTLAMSAHYSQPADPVLAEAFRTLGARLG